MTVLSSKKILQENNTSDPSSITSLTLTHKALSDVSCLGEFKNLERLDLGFNNLTSLEGLKSCLNLKWLSVLQNKLQSLNGIEGLSKLSVFNAGKNKLKSMDEVKSLVNLRALILNDNDISSVCKLDQMKELNTLVLSRNPIRTLGESVVKLKSITKLSLSHCQLQTIDSSLKSCAELKELRLAHNEITVSNLPSEFARLIKLQNLDVGNNLITNWSNLKVLSSLVNLKSLNLHGNPVAEKKILVKKVKKLVPNLQIYNARPIHKIMTREETGKVEVSWAEKISRERYPNDTGEHGSAKKRKNVFDEKTLDSREDGAILEKKMKKKLKALQQNDSTLTDDIQNPKLEPGERKKSKHKTQKTDELISGNASDLKGDPVTTEKKPDKKSRKKMKEYNVNVIDSSETPFTELFTTDATELRLDNDEKKGDHKTAENIEAASGFVIIPNKKKKKKNRHVPAALQLSPAREVGLGGPSTWDDL